MTAVITHNRRRSRLSSLIDQPGGISVGVALRQAKINLAELEGRSLEIIEEAFRLLDALPHPEQLDLQKAALNQAYDLTASIIDAAAPFGRIDLCRAASNLCDLLDGWSDTQLFDWRILTVHIQSFRLLMNIDSSDTMTIQQVLNSLQNVQKVKLGS